MRSSAASRQRGLGENVVMTELTTASEDDNNGCDSEAGGRGSVANDDGDDVSTE